MPRNSGGVYSPPTGTLAVSGTVISSPAYDAFVGDLSTELTNSVNCQGTAPMLASLNLGGFTAINGATPVAATDLAIKSYVDTSLPAGFILAWPTFFPPAGFLQCNGASLSTTTYARLFAVIGYVFGGSGANFNIPDYRGCFLRGVDNGRGLDFQGTRGTQSFQASYLINHFHTMGDPSHNHGLPQSPHGHGDPGHTHGVSDPGHAHTVTAGLGGGINITPGSGFNINAAVGTSANVTGVSIFGAVTGIQAANANISINPAVTGVSVSSVSTGNVNFGAETTVQNYPVIWSIKY